MLNATRHTSVLRLAARQDGVVSLDQLIGLGVPAGTVRGCVGVTLHRIHRGVYAVGRPDIAYRGRLFAAVLACGRGAVLSHRSAADLLGLLATDRLPIDVTTPVGRDRPGIDSHIARLASDEVWTVDRLPCTTVARTLLDIAAILPLRRVIRALEQAEAEDQLDTTAIADQIARRRGHHGAPRLRAALATLADPDLTRSKLERIALALFRARGLPEPVVNAHLALQDGGEPLTVDFLWRDSLVVLEADSHRWHRTAAAFERDRERDQRLVLAGYRPLRCTWRQILDQPDRIVAAILVALGVPDFAP